MLCHFCHRATPGILCGRCRREVRPGPELLLGSGVRLISAFEHTGPARKLVHDLKYRWITRYADLVARVLAPRVPPVPLVPVPRVLSRRARYGVDPAYEIAVRVGSIVGQPVLDLLSAPLHASRRAGGDHSRQVAGLAVKHEVPRQIVLVDDVVTTGATLVAAASLVGENRVSVALVANAPPQVSSLSRR